MHHLTHPWRLAWLVALAAALLACTGESVPGPEPDSSDQDSGGDALDDGLTDVGDTVTSDGGDAVDDTQPPWWLDMPTLPVCEPALALTPATATTATRGIVTFQASGGTGDYTFSLDARPSGASIEAGLGTYRAGDIDGVVDVVRVTDSGCEGSATAQVTVESPFVLQPREVVTRPGISFTFVVEGGTGDFDFALGAGAGSGATLTADGRYTAGAEDGLDLVIVTDVSTGQSLDATVRVDAASTFELVPPTLAMPDGHRFLPRATSGSGLFDGTVAPSTVATLGERALEATAPGSATVSLTDRFTGDSATLELVVAAALPWTAQRYGDGDQWATIPSSVGDIDGDGFVDAVVGVPEADIAGHQSGGVFVYRGSAAGLEPAPVRILADAGRLADFGQDIAIADVDGDGLRDLVIGAPDADVDLGDAGGVFIYPGVEGDFFTEAPARVIGGAFRGDRFGYSVAACDFNGDGFDDLAVGARFAEDRRISPLIGNQGAVYVYLGGPGGLQAAPTDSLFGMTVEGAALTPTRDLNLGTAMAPADYDGDGLCDLAVGALSYKGQEGRSNDGAVFIYRGRADTETRFGGLDRQPARMIGGIGDDDGGGQLGRHLSGGDLDGDGRAELAMSHGADNTDGLTRNGAVRLAPGIELTGPADTVEAPDSFAWSLAGDNPYDQYGWSVEIADVTGDDTPDLIVGSSADELPDRPGTAGVVRVYAGTSGALPALEPTWEVDGPTDDGPRLGGRVGAPGDLDGDGVIDILAYASFDHTFGTRAGRSYQILGTDHTLVGLDQPGAASGARVGSALAVVAGQGGRHYIAVGAPFAGHDDDPFGGVVEIYEVSAGQIGASSQRLAGFAGHSASDELGYAVANAGDFDGDGLDDLLVVARSDEAPGDFDAASWTVLGSCIGSPNNAGAVFVFRGTGSGFEDVPAFVHYGPWDDQIATVTGDLDVNGDGLADLVYGGPGWDAGAGGGNSGGFGVVLGRALPAATAGTIHVICDAALTFDGPGGGDEMGGAVAAAGDLDGDGCDDFAVGARRYDLDGANDSGLVEVHFGWDAAAVACPAARRRVALTTSAVDSEAGTSIAGGHDVTGDGVPDLVVGAPDFRIDGATTGRIIVVDGARVGSLPTIAAGQGGADPGTTRALVEPAPGARAWHLNGDETGEDFGESVALLPGAGPGGRALIVTGRPGVSLGQPGGAGAVSIYVFRNAEGLDGDPVAVVGGESEMVEPHFGAAVAAARHDARSLVVVGSPLSSAASIDEGAAFGFVLP